MFIEKLKQIYTNFTAAVNQLLSGLFNDGVLISEEKMPLILAGFALLILLTCLFVWFLLRKRSLKNKAPHELSGRDKEQRLAQREKERAKELELQIKQEEKLQQEKEAAQIAKAEELEKDLQEQIASMEEERRNQQVLEREIEKDAEIEEPPEKTDSFIERLRKGVGKTRTHILDNLSEAVFDYQNMNCGSYDNAQNLCEAYSEYGCSWEFAWGGWQNYGSYCAGGSFQIENSYCAEVSFLPGDANGDGSLNVSDIVLIVDLILNSEYDEYSDLNQDGILNVIDVVELVSIILNN